MFLVLKSEGTVIRVTAGRSCYVQRAPLGCPVARYGTVDGMCTGGPCDSS